jgi:hypothetical protein
MDDGSKFYENDKVGERGPEHRRVQPGSPLDKAMARKLGSFPTPTRDDLSEEQRHLRGELVAFMDYNAAATKAQAGSRSKKELARELTQVKGVLRVVRDATAKVGAVGQMKFAHAEAFAQMRYVSKDGGGLVIWNSRDGVTPFVLHLGGVEYTHDVRAMTGPFFDRPAGCTHEWVTRTPEQALRAWVNHIANCVERGQVTMERANQLQAKMPEDRSWFIGIRDLASGLIVEAGS